MVPSPNQQDVYNNYNDNDNNNRQLKGGWLSGLGLQNTSSSSSLRMRGNRSSLSRISSSQRISNTNDIISAIANDQDLFFADDEPMDRISHHSSAEGACRMGHMMLSSKCTSQQQKSTTYLIESEQPRRSSTVGMPSRSSQHKMEVLQREVDLALEMFQQETENELDDGTEDGDGYLANYHTSKRQQQLQQYQNTQSSSSGSGSDECDGDDSFPGTAATSMATSVTTDYDAIEYGDCQFNKFLSLGSEYSSTTTSPEEPQTPRISNSIASNSPKLSLKHKTKSILQLPLSLIPSQTALNCADDSSVDDESLKFENVLAQELSKVCISEEERRYRSVDFNKGSIRNALEPFLAVARLRREEARQQVFDTLDRVSLPQEVPASRRTSMASTSSDIGFHIGSSYGVPYPTLRHESSFLYDTESYPLAKVLAETLGVEDLSQIHVECPLKKDKGRLLKTLQNRGKRRNFHHCFDSFVISQVIPLLHSQGLAKGVFHTNRHQLRKGKPQSIIYRYQAFPSINIVRPGESSTDPHCDLTQGHSMGSISYHIPLTATYGTNAVYTESRPGREDWHPLVTKSPGLGFQFDGARCLHFNLKNETDITRVSLNFRIVITRAQDCHDIDFDPDDQLCCPELLEDKFSQIPNFYDEVEVKIGDTQRSFPGPVATKYRSKGSISVVG